MFKKRLQIRGLIRQYLKELERLGVRPQRVILYGSFANGKPKQYSDVDLLIISEDFKKMNLRQRLEILGIAAARILKPIEAYGCTEDEFAHSAKASFLEEIRSTGVNVALAKDYS